MREGRIDLDWLDTEMSLAESKYLEIPFMKENELASAFMKLAVLTVVRSKCTLIEPPVFLSKTCINEWESNQYCDKKDACEMCKLK